MISFRPHSQKDIPLRVKWFNNSIANKYIGDGKNTGLREENKWFQEYQKLRKNKGKYFFTICCDKKSIGCVGLSNINYDSKKGQLFIIIGEPEYYGKGIGTAATKFMVDFAFKKLGLHKVTPGVFADNLGAIRCYEKAGFGVEGVLKDDFFINGKYHDMVLMGKIKKK